jgi:hypothetical protein
MRDDHERGGDVAVLLRGKAGTHGERWGWNRVSSGLSEARERGLEARGTRARAV